MPPFFNFHTALAVDKADIYEKLHNLIALHSITIEEERLIFPIDNELDETETDKRNIIHFADVLYIDDHTDFIDIVVRSGHLHILSIHEPKRAYLSLYKELFYKSKLTLREATDVVHDVWVQMNEAHTKT